MTNKPPLYLLHDENDDAYGDEDFEAILARYMDGDREALRELDPEMAATVIHMVGLADRSGHRQSPVRRLTGRRLTIVAAAVAAIALVGFLGVIGWRVLDDGDDPAPTRAAFLDAPSTPIPSPTPTEAVSGYVIPPLTPSDCALAPRTQEDVMALLGTPPAPGARVMAADQPAATTVINDLNATLRGWQACNESGDLYGAFAYESDQYIREDIYGNAAFDQPFSKGTLNEILSAWQRTMSAEVEASGGDFHAVWMVDASRDVFVSRDGTHIEAWVVPIDPRDGSIEDSTEPARMMFIKEGGMWRIRIVDPAFVPR